MHFLFDLEDGGVGLVLVLVLVLSLNLEIRGSLAAYRKRVLGRTLVALATFG